MTDPDNVRCARCGGKSVPGKTTFCSDLGFGVVVVRNVRALVCERCGEEWLAPEIARRLEEIVERARRERHQVEVMEMVT